MGLQWPGISRNGVRLYCKPRSTMHCTVLLEEEEEDEEKSL
jgi:hypothetical protein